MGMLSDIIADIRDATDEPATDAKYTDTKLLSLISKAVGHVWQDVNKHSVHKAVVRADLSITSGTSVYVLPPTMRHIIDLQWLNSDGTIRYRLYPGSTLNPVWPGLSFEGNTLRFTNGYEPDTSWTLRVIYTPSGYVSLAEGPITSVTNDAANNNCTVVLNATVTDGVLDYRPSAYAGCIFRLLTAIYLPASSTIQDRLVTAWDPDTRTLTLEPAFDEVVATASGSYGAFAGGTTPVTADAEIFTDSMVGRNLRTNDGSLYVIASVTSSTVVEVTGDASGETDDETIEVLSTRFPAAAATYEIVPMGVDDLVWPVALYVARFINGVNGDRDRYALANTLYIQAVRDVRLQETHYETLRGTVFNISHVRTNSIDGPQQRLDGGAASFCGC